MPLLRTWQFETIWFEVLLIHLGHHRCLGFCKGFVPRTTRAWQPLVSQRGAGLAGLPQACCRSLRVQSFHLVHSWLIWSFFIFHTERPLGRPTPWSVWAFECVAYHDTSGRKHRHIKVYCSSFVHVWGHFWGSTMFPAVGLGRPCPNGTGWREK